MSEEENLNEKNYGFGIEKHYNSHYLAIGYFKNSHNNDSLYAIIGKETKHMLINTGYLAGIANGYNVPSAEKLTKVDSDIAAIAGVTFPLY